MKNQSILSWIAAVLAMLMLLPMAAGCARVTEKLDEVFPEESEAVTTELPEDAKLPQRERRTYVVLLALRAASFDSITTLSLLTFDTEDKSVHWLQLPANLFVHVAETTVAQVFASTYRTEIAKEGVTEMEATDIGMNAIRTLLSRGFNIPIDYYVSFDPDQLASFVGTLQGIPIVLDTPMGGLGAGKATLDAKDLRSFLGYDRYSDPATESMNARRVLAAALWRQAGKVITPESLSLYVAQLRGQFATDIPYSGGEDVFFWRRFLQAAPEAFSITAISAQSIYYNNTACQVMNKANVLRQLNEQMQVYEDSLTNEQFDPDCVFADFSNAVVRTVYTAVAELPQLYTMQELDPDYQPEETVPDESQTPAA